MVQVYLLTIGNNTKREYNKGKKIRKMNLALPGIKVAVVLPRIDLRYQQVLPRVGFLLVQVALLRICLPQTCPHLTCLR